MKAKQRIGLMLLGFCALLVNTILSAEGASLSAPKDLPNRSS